MRGKQSKTASGRINWRITPAHAGKTLHKFESADLYKDHPRACGENPYPHSPYMRRRGSPPRMRGKPVYQNLETRNKRITPAHAGKTLASHNELYNNADHPRACGENGLKRSTAWSESGSPPRMRGKHMDSFYNPEMTRITPAHAGKTGNPYKYLRCATDHPRACGENHKRALQGEIEGGSPPRMRGKHGFLHFRPLCSRITPAHAGKTHRSPQFFQLSADHPRACGENPL